MKEHLNTESRNAIVNYRIEKSDISMKEAELMAENGFFDSAVTRLYYACYYILSALLIKNSIEANTHQGVKRMFSLKFIAPGILDQKYIKIYSKLLQGRQISDYEDFIYQNKESYSLYYEEALDFCKTIKTLLTSH